MITRLSYNTNKNKNKNKNKNTFDHQILYDCII